MKTKIRELSDGRREVIRLLSADSMDGWSMDDPLTYEKSIIWLRDISDLPFVRVKWVHKARSRRGPLYLGAGGETVGYSRLTPDAPRDPTTGGYIRRVFYRLESDDAIELLPGDALPESAIDPRTIVPGALSHDSGSRSRHLLSRNTNPH